jgi:predicted ArsR family transcriptional regulator
VDIPVVDNLLSQPTRARLFALLAELREPATTDELAAKLGHHVNGIRRHLERLRKGGLVERRRRADGPGRPRDEWMIAPGARPAGEPPHAYGDLARWLARAFPSGRGQLRHVERTGREIGHELAPAGTDDVAEGLRQSFAVLGFEPEVDRGVEGRVRCTLRNCPYRASVRENQDLICTLHRGITEGLLDRIDASVRLDRFEPKDPDQAGCIVEVVGAPDTPS